jgi:hypothetical protein
MMAVMPGDRPQPPGELQPDEAEEWRKIVERLPQDWFRRETHPVLIQLCRHICIARRVAGRLADVEAATERPKGWFETYRDLVRMQGQTAMVIANLSVKLRLTKSSQTDSRVAAMGATRTLGRPKPWIMADAIDDDQPKTN